MNPKLARSTDKLVRWVQEEALPLWSQCGVDSRNGSAFEKLTPKGAPDLTSSRRLRVQARQMFVFSRAEQMGWAQGLGGVVKRMGEFVSRYGTLPSRSDGYVHLVDHDFNVIDDKFDVYDHAFFLLSSGASYGAYGRYADQRRAYNIANWLDSKFKHPAGGWKEGNYSAPFRRQNPHMHLFEAFLFLYEVTNKDVWLDRAQGIHQLFLQHFYSAQDGVVQEYFDDNWNLAEGAEGEAVEPGHMMEWIWLLRWYERVSGKDQGAVANRLYQRTLEIGRDEASGLLFDCVDRNGRVVVASKRLWPLTEYIKASLSQARCGYGGAEEHAAEGIELLFEYYISSTVSGTYIDRRGPDNEVCDPTVFASTLYHLLGAAIEAHEYARASIAADA